MSGRTFAHSRSVPGDPACTDPVAFDTAAACASHCRAMRAFLVAYPWDLLDDRLDATLDRLRGEVGVTGVSLWTAAPPVLYVRGRVIEPRVVRSEGGVLFPTDEKHYAATRCKPVPASWLKGKDPLGRIASACQTRGMELRAVVSASRIGRLPQRYLETACKNAFGAESHVSVCLANPDVANFLCSLVAEVSTTRPITGVVLRDFDTTWAEAFASSLAMPSVADEPSRSLLSVCFCESCRQRAGDAGVDVAAACRSVQVMLQRRFDDGDAAPCGIDSAAADDPAVSALLRWRRDELARLLSRLVQECKAPLTIGRGMDRGTFSPLDDAALRTPAAVITTIGSADELATAFAPNARRNELNIPASFATGPRGPELVTTFSRAVELGFSAVEIDDFGLLPDPAFAPIRQAIRFARRNIDAR